MTFFKLIANRWVWWRCLSKLREPQVDMKVTMTTLWAATTKRHHTENLSGKFEILTKTHPERGKGWEQKGLDRSTNKDNACKMT